MGSIWHPSWRSRSGWEGASRGWTLLCRMRIDLCILRTVPRCLPGDRVREVDPSVGQLVLEPQLSPPIFILYISFHHQLSLLLWRRKQGRSSFFGRERRGGSIPRRRRCLLLLRRKARRRGGQGGRLLNNMWSCGARGLLGAGGCLAGEYRRGKLYWRKYQQATHSLFWR
jgi:hypothetical protein